MTIACRANGIDPVDGPYANFRNPEAYTREAERANTLGMVGKWAIHPSQIEIAQAVFSPNAEAVEMARKQTAAYAEALEQGLGAIDVDGVMVDAASIRIVQNTLDRADLYGI
jgi:citrate lyase subunit beta/citryl-CoA lyase